MSSILTRIEFFILRRVLASVSGSANHGVSAGASALSTTCFLANVTPLSEIVAQNVRNILS